MLLLLFLSKDSSRPVTHRSSASIAHLVAAALLAALVVVLGFGSGASAEAQAEDDMLAGLPVTVENTFASDELTQGEEIVFGSAGPTKVSDEVEFADCCDGFYDIDIASDRITMTWIGDDEYARTIEAGTFDRYRFTVVGATFANAEADPDQNLVPDVTFFANSISVKIAEGDEVGPGQDAVILIEPIVTAESRADAAAADTEAEQDDADAAEDDAAASDDDDDEELETLPRTGRTTELVTATGLFLLALGLITYGVGNRARRMELA